LLQVDIDPGDTKSGGWKCQLYMGKYGKILEYTSINGGLELGNSSINGGL
jgi:hypothetical protein